MERHGSEDGSERELGSNHKPELTHAGSDRQAIKMMLVLGAGMAGFVAIVLSDLTLADRIRFLAYMAIAVVLMLLLARFIVYSYRRDRGRLNPYHRDHIVK